MVSIKNNFLLLLLLLAYFLPFKFTNLPQTCLRCLITCVPCSAAWWYFCCASLFFVVTCIMLLLSLHCIVLNSYETLACLKWMLLLLLLCVVVYQLGLKLKIFVFDSTYTCGQRFGFCFNMMVFSYAPRKRSKPDEHSSKRLFFFIFGVHLNLNVKIMERNAEVGSAD